MSSDRELDQLKASVRYPAEPTPRPLAPLTARPPVRSLHVWRPTLQSA